MKIRIRVSRFEIPTRMSEIPPDPTTDVSSKPLAKLVKATIKNAAPKSLGTFFFVVISSPRGSTGRGTQ
jgi:hypothetical protein